MTKVMYLLPCEACGRKVAIDKRQAGVEVQCQCGHWSTAPTLRGVRSLEEVEVDDNHPRVPDRSTQSANERATPVPSPTETTLEPASDTASSATADRSKRPALLTLAATGMLLLASVTLWFQWPTTKTKVSNQIVVDLVDTEEWILNQTPELQRLNSAALNLTIPDHQSRTLFADDVTYIGLDDRPPSKTDQPSLLGTSHFDWSISQRPDAAKRDSLQLWQPLLKKIDFFERTKFYFVKASYSPDQRNRIESEVGFEGLAHDHEGNRLLISGKLKLRWRPEDISDPESPWQIEAFQTEKMGWTARRQPMFEDVLTNAIPDPDLLERVRQSLHEEMLIEVLSGQSADSPRNHFSQLEISTTEHHPGLSVIDIDRDGWDDLYVMGRWGKNILLHNQGDGTFKDLAPQLGLDIEDRCSSAVFADFDNDGDADLMLGRSLKPSMHLVNQDGRFVDRSDDLVDGPMPALVYSVSAADYNRDGLLDVLFATSAIKADVNALRVILPPEDAQGLEEHLQQADPHTVLAKMGPPNVLLVNRGGRFERAPESRQIAGWRNTNQATWGDYDGDGDPDLYLSNDFSLNHLFRNDGEQGFTDVTEETNTGDIGFGMGASWGDFDNDQVLDLYVTNMFSKAGRRITAQISSLDPRFANMARGNSLFHNRQGKFEKISGLDAPAMQVEKAGWSWGGQFIDVDNNGFLDIYALSGYYTAPEEVALNVDL